MAPPDSSNRVTRRQAAALAAAALAFAAAVVAAIALSGSSSHTAASTTASAPVQTPAVPAAQPPPGTARFGINVNRLFNDQTYSPQQIGSQLAALQKTGAMLARSDSLWEATEPTAPAGGVHRYDWTFDDSIATALAQHGLQWLPIVDYSAPWAESVAGQDHSPPTSAADYAAYAGALAARYGSGGSFWRAHPELHAQPVDTFELWNEPDNPTFFKPRPDAARYAAMYTLARQAILNSDPSARVIVGGLTAAPSFVPEMLAAAPDLRGHIDGIAIHPYGANPLVVLAKIRQDRQVLDAAGLGSVPLYVTEFGWTTHPPSALQYLPERLRPRYISQALAALGHVNCGVAAVTLYTWVTPERYRADLEDWFGIHSPSGASTPDSAAFAAGIKQAMAPGTTIALC
jgi:polysaccharide biosynthesis protein PslG